MTAAREIEVDRSSLPHAGRRTLGSWLRQRTGERIPLRAPLEALALVLLLAAVSGGLGTAISPANHALLCMTAVVVAGIRHGFWFALAVSLAGVAVMSFFHLEPRFSFQAERAEDWVTLVCFGLASFLTGNLAGRFRRQLEETRTVAEHNERLYEASRLLAATFRTEELIRVVLEAASAVSGSETLLLLPDPAGSLVPAHAWSGDLDDSDRAAAESAHREMRPVGPGTHGGWCFLPLIGERGALGVLGVRPAPGVLSDEQQRLLSALCHSAGVALERCRLSEEMRSAQMTVETEKLRAALLSSVSHDLRTPLASIIGATSTLHDIGESVPQEQQRELLSMVLKEAERLDRFVGNLLDMTRIGYGKLKPRPTWCDVRDVIAEVVRGLHLVLARPPLQVSIDPDFPLLFVDAVLLERVIENLVDNAVKHGGGEEAVEVTAHLEEGQPVIRVLDRGPGLSDRARPRTLVQRARDSDRRSAGSGMGLAICQGFVEALAGSLALLDRPDGRGLCAEIRLPLAEPGEKERP